MSDYIDPDLDDAKLRRLQFDIVTAILPQHEIAKRYGFADVKAMANWFLERPGLLEATDQMQTLWESDNNADERTRAKALHATEMLIAPVYLIAQETKYPPAVRVDAFKQLTRVAGVDGSAAQIAAKGGGGHTGLTLNITFRDKPPERLEMTPAPVIDMRPAIPDEEDED